MVVCETCSAIFTRLIGTRIEAFAQATETSGGTVAPEVRRRNVDATSASDARVLMTRVIAMARDAKVEILALTLERSSVRPQDASAIVLTRTTGTRIVMLAVVAIVTVGTVTRVDVTR